MATPLAIIQPVHALVLGVLEGLTEFVPVSSTGHLILGARLLGLQGAAVDTFTIVIQAGALGAVVGLYRGQVRALWRGLSGRDEAGRRLALNLLVSFLPAAVVGVLFHHTIKARLFSAGAVAAALAAGGALMIGVDRWHRSRAGSPRTLQTVTLREALWIGCAQCLSLWPGASRAMVTIVAGLLLGWPAVLAAEYSFLLALPTLGAAAVFDLLTGGRELAAAVGGLSLACGFLAAAGVATLAVHSFLRSLPRWGLEPFGWYRLALAVVVWWLGVPR